MFATNHQQCREHAGNATPLDLLRACLLKKLASPPAFSFTRCSVLSSFGLLERGSPPRCLYHLVPAPRSWPTRQRTEHRTLLVPMLRIWRTLDCNSSDRLTEQCTINDHEPPGRDDLHDGDRGFEHGLDVLQPAGFVELAHEAAESTLSVAKTEMR